MGSLRVWFIPLEGFDKEILYHIFSSSSFCVCVCVWSEGLHGLIMHAAIVGDIKGFALCKRSLELIHLLFVDDSLFFCRVTPEEYNKIMELLTIYENASGQKVNWSKIAIFFSKSIPKDTKDIIKGILVLQEINQYEKYLGPSQVGRDKKVSFNYIKERVWTKLQGWEGKLLSQTGREVLIKAVIQAILTFAMGCFMLPLGLCHEIKALIKTFW